MQKPCIRLKPITPPNILLWYLYLSYLPDFCCWTGIGLWLCSASADGGHAAFTNPKPPWLLYLVNVVSKHDLVWSSDTTPYTPGFVSLCLSRSLSGSLSGVTWLMQRPLTTPLKMTPVFPLFFTIPLSLFYLPLSSVAPSSYLSLCLLNCSSHWRLTTVS